MVMVNLYLLLTSSSMLPCRQFVISVSQISAATSIQYRWMEFNLLDSQHCKMIFFTKKSTLTSLFRKGMDKDWISFRIDYFCKLRVTFQTQLVLENINLRKDAKQYQSCKKRENNKVHGLCFFCKEMLLLTFLKFQCLFTFMVLKQRQNSQ